MAGKVTFFDIDGQHYRASPLLPRTALHIAKRLLQLAKALTPAAQAETMQAISIATQVGEKTETKPDMIALMMPFVGSLGDALSQLSDTDFDYILDRCMEMVERQSAPDVWAKLVAPRGGMMFADITAPMQLIIIGHVLKDNLGDFFPELLRLLGIGPQDSRPALH